MSPSQRNPPADDEARQRQPVREKASPIPMTQEEVEAMAAGGAGIEAIVERLRASEPYPAAPEKVAPSRSPEDSELGQ